MAKGIKLGENLNYLRKSKKLTRNQFANQFNAHISEVTRWENDTTPLDDKTIEKIALFYGITKDELISGSFKENNVPTNEIVKEDINEENIIDNYDNRFKKIFLFEKVLCGITTQDSGDIIIDNVDIKMMDYKTKSIYMIFKGGALFETMSVFKSDGFPKSLLSAA